MAKKASKKAATKKTVTKKASSKKAASKKVAAKKVAAKKVAAKKVAAKKVAAKVAATKTSSKKPAASKPETTKKTPALKQVQLAKVASRKAEMQKLESMLRELLNSKKKLLLEWDCGGDETIVNGKIDKKVWAANTPEFMTLSDILIEELQLPNAGEEFNKGGGSIELDNGQIIVTYDCVYHAYGWDEDAEEEIEVPPEKRLGKLLLFPAPN